MANRILTEPGWEDRIRDKLGVNDATLPDAVLQSPDVITVAEAKVIAAVPKWQELTGDDRLFLEAATVCMAAIQVIDSMPARLPTRMQGPGMDVTLEIDWKERRAALQAERDEYLGRIDGSDSTGGIGGFWLAGPSRRR